MLMRGLVYDLPKILLLFVKMLLISFVVVLPVNSLIAMVCMVYDLFYLPLVIIESGNYDIPSKIFVCLCIPILLPIFTISSLFVVTLRILYGALSIAILLHSEYPCRPFEGCSRIDWWKVIKEQVVEFYNFRMDTKVQEEIRKKTGPPEIKLPVCTALMSLPVSFIGGFSSLLVTCIYAVFVAPAIFLISIPGFIVYRPFQLIAYCTILSPLVLGFYFGILVLGYLVALAYVVIAIPVSFFVGCCNVLRWIPSNEGLSAKPWVGMWIGCVSVHIFAVECVAMILNAAYTQNVATIDRGSPVFRKHIEKAFTYRDSLITRYRMDIYDQDGIQEIVVNTTGANSGDGGRDHGEPNAPTTLARQTSDTPIEIQYFSGIFKTTWNGGRLPLSVVWNSFFNQCYTQGANALNAKYVKISDFQEREPYLFIGLPSLVIYVCIHRSVYEVKSDGLVLTSGVEVNEDNRPGGPIGNMFWNPAMAMKERMKELNLSHMEDSFLRYSILKQDISEAKAKEVLVQYSEKRMKELNEIIAMANSMAINVSRLARYTRRFAEVMDRLGSGNNVGLVITNAPDSEMDISQLSREMTRTDSNSQSHVDIEIASV